MIVTRTITKGAATGALTGLALGDALGFPTEFNNVPSILAKCGPWRQMRLPRPAIVSDDTQMTLALARGIRTAMDRGLLTALRLTRPVREEFVEWYHSPDNNRAPGRTCMTACRLLDSDRLWQEASQTGSKGCGANMRVAPVGLVPGLSEEQRSGAAQLQAALTHGHPTALAASDLMARAVYLLAQGAGRSGADRAAALVRLREQQPLPLALARRPVAVRGRRLRRELHPARLGRVPDRTGPGAGRPARPVTGGRPVRDDR